MTSALARTLRSRLGEVMPCESKTFGGACLVYVVIAACNAGENSARYVDSDGSAPNGHDGSSGADGSGGDLLDALTNPVADAKADPATSGTRLKAKYYAGADGSRQFVGWHDAQRDEDCYFGAAADGVLRCAPFRGDRGWRCKIGRTREWRRKMHPPARQKW